VRAWKLGVAAVAMVAAVAPPASAGAAIRLEHSIAGVRLGMTSDEVRAILGEPAETREDPLAGGISRYAKHDMRVMFNPQSRLAYFIETRDPAEVGPKGVRVGMRRATLRRRLRVVCGGFEPNDAPLPAGDRHCLHPGYRERNPRVTAFGFTNDRVVGIAVTGDPDVAEPEPGQCTDQKLVVGVVEALSECFTVSDQIARSVKPVRVNGIDLEPQAGAEIEIDQRRKILTSTGAVTVRLGWIHLSRPSLRVDLARQSSYKIKVGGKDGIADIAGLPIKGSAELKFEPGRTIGTISVELPKLLKAKGKHRRQKATSRPTVEIGLQATNQAGLRPETIGAEWELLELPAGFEATDVKIKYQQTAELKHKLEGGGTLWMRGRKPLGIEVKFVFVQGGTVEVTAGAENLNKRLWGPVYLQRLALTLGINPAKFGRAVGLTLGPQIKLHGQEPFRVARLDGEITTTYDDPFTWVVKGKGKLVQADIEEAELEARSNRTADLKGDVVWRGPLLFERYGIRGHVEGWLEDSAVLLQGRVRMAMPGLDQDAEAVVSSAGVAACRRGSGPDVGFGQSWGGAVEVMGSSCGIGPWTPSRPSESGVRSAQGAGPATFRVPARRRTVAFRVDGTAGAPLVTVTGPRGLRLDTPPAPDGSLSTAKALVVKDTARNTTYVAIDRPARGAYTVTPAPGTPPIAGVHVALAHRSVSVRARVRGRGLHRRLRFRTRNLAGARVQFVEQGRDGRNLIATTRRARGTLRFRPARGRGGRRRIVAVVLRDGLPEVTRTVASYRAGRRR
jgi:hypothetical protein